MQLAEYPTALPAWGKQCVPDWWKPDVIRPDIVEIPGSATTATHAIEYPPPPSFRMHTNKHDEPMDAMRPAQGQRCRHRL